MYKLHNKLLFKIFVLFVFISVYFFVSGCSTTSSPFNSDAKTVTLSGNVIAPAVNIPGFLPSVMQSLLASSTCTVNGKPAQCIIASDSSFNIYNVEQNDAFVVKLTAKYLSLYAYIPGNGTDKAVSPFGLSNKSTADYFIRQAYAADMNIDILQLANYDVDINLLSRVENVINTNLADASCTIDILNSRLASLRKDFLKNIEFFDALNQKRPYRDLDENWRGDIYYYVFDSDGKRSLGVSATAEFSINIDGSKAYGSAKITPDFSSLTSNLSFYFEGKVSKDGVIRFRRRGTSGTVSEPLLDSWVLFPVSGGLAVKSENIDFNNRGIEVVPAKSILEEGFTSLNW